MELREAERLARELMDEWGLGDWTFKISRARQTFGSVKRMRGGGPMKDGAPGWITLSGPLTRLNDRDKVEDTIRHEIAHALVPQRAGHGPEWKRQCRIVGAKPVRCYDATDVVAPPAPYELVCLTEVPEPCRSPRQRRTRATYRCRRHSAPMELRRRIR